MTHNVKIKAGILGAGGISEFHIKGLRRLADVEIVGVADVYQARASELAERFSVPRIFPSLAAMLEARPDVIHVLTPPGAHADNAIEALRGGCHVLVEKPLATSVEECDAIAAAAAEAGKSVCVGHSLLRDPFVARALEIARSGAIGDVVGVDHFRGQFYAPYAGGRCRTNSATAAFRSAIWASTRFTFWMRCWAGSKTQRCGLAPRRADGCPFFKDWRMLVQCKRGMGQIYISWNVKPLQDVLVVHGTRGVIPPTSWACRLPRERKAACPGPPSGS